MHRTLRTLVTAALIGLAASAVHAADPFPNKPVKLIVPFATGGGTDALARLVAQVLSDKWKQPVVVENKAGAEGVVGSALVAQSPPDGYTLLWAVQSHAINPSVRLNMPFDTLKAFAPITLVAQTPYVVAASNKLTAKSMAELLSYAQANPGKLSFGSSDPGARIMGELLKTSASIEMVNVSYKGSGPIMNDLLGNHLEIGFVSLPSAQSNYKAGTLRLLAVSTAQRTPLAPELPTIAESGVKDFDIAIWWGMLAPAGTPPAIVEQIYKDLVQIANDTDFRQQLMQRGATPVLSSPKAFSEFLVADVARAERVVKQAGMKPE
ncbi:MAG: tripartite tricarboxylate transporter substrate binding protein [Burkholderiales bacterium]